MGAFEWISQIIEWFGKLIPRWVIVPTTHGWVAFVKGSEIYKGGAGIVWYWPAWTEFNSYPVARQTVPLASQTLTIAGDTTVVLGGMLVYEIADLEKILAHTYDPEDTIKDIAASALADVCVRWTWEELQKGQGRTLDTQLRKRAEKELGDYGVRVIKFTLTTLAQTRVYRLVMSTAQEGEIR